MTSFLAYLLLWVWNNLSWEALQRSYTINAEVAAAYEGKDYQKAVQLYQNNLITMAHVSPEARLNLAHLYYQLGKLDKAEENYELAAKSPNPRLRSYAISQLALIAVQEQDTARALLLLQDALRAIPTNTHARLNYEILKGQYSGALVEPARVLKSEFVKPYVAKNEQEQQEATVVEDEKREQLLKRLQNIGMKEEEARALLEAMKAQEKEYIYQLKQHRYGADKPKSKKIEW